MSRSKIEKVAKMSDEEMNRMCAESSKTADETMRLALDTLDRSLEVAKSTRRSARRLVSTVDLIGSRTSPPQRRLLVVKK